MDALLEALAEMKSRRGPRLLHVMTQKGRGYELAEKDPIKYHGVTPFDPQLGIVPPARKPAPTFTQVFGDWLCDAVGHEPRLVAITPAMREGSGLVGFAQRHPDRYFDVGIAEQHAVTFAAGLAADGMKPFAAIYSTFLQRGYDQVVHDVALQRLPVLFAIDRAGLVGPDGATHNGGLDLSFLRCVPGMTIMAPADGEELRNMLHTGLRCDGPVAVRYPRANTAAPRHDAPLAAIPIGSSELRRCGTGVALLSFGTMLDAAFEVADELDATVVNMRFVKPLDTQRILEMARSHELLVTLEESAVAGGAGAGVNEFLASQGITTPVLNLGLPDAFLEHGTREEALTEAGLDTAAMLAAIVERQQQGDIPVRPARHRSYGSFNVGGLLRPVHFR